MKIRENVFGRIGETMHTQVLGNGLTICTVPKPQFSKSYAFFATNYGGADRRFSLDGKRLDTPAGIAHFLEHKLFDTETGNALMDLAANGASPNAFTSNEITGYFFECTDNFYDNLKTLLSFVSIPFFTQESVQKEQGIIGQEIRMINDNPGSRQYYNYLKALYKHHPARDAIAGTEESIAQITPQTLYDCHKVFYTPSNMVLCLVGDIDATRAGEIAESILPRQAGEIPQKDYGAPEGPEPFMEKLEERMEVFRPLFMAGTKVCGDFTGDEYLKLDLVGDLASKCIAGTSSRLYSKMYAQGLITNNFSANISVGRSMASTVFVGESSEPERVIDEVKREIERILISGIDNKELTRLKKMSMGGVLRRLDHFEYICYSQAEAHFADATIFRQAEVLDNIRKDDIMDFVREHMKPENFALSLIVPQNK